jgi:hypothetical protein
VLLTAAISATGTTYGAELCEACWEVGGRAGVMAPSEDAGLGTTPGVGAFGLFHFRRFWSVQFGLDRHPGAIDQGPDETLTFFLVRGAFTFRAERDQRTRPFAFFGAGLVFDHVGTDEREITTPAGSIRARSDPDSDTGPAYIFGVGGVTSLKERTWLRYEAQWITWSTFGIGQEGFRVLAALTWRLGR